ncbi:type I-F CRISPR-associated endoribonuclease Cas6/Csy4 [Leisingera caerulea]|uniref:type I-F CRISPR-associated endoribonuclease Cas6/Csy4 n=1 Tax=Leisingera caerulea TaxID=506591 RepID=UPI00042608ED|nr:type I-F CRISPR-associated endoribonuclease Cas6/Csy4 [Leisingera caerulea]
MTSATSLAAGAGHCDPAFKVRIRPYREVLDLGAGPDILRAVFGAVHRANRHSSPQDFAAISLPAASGARGYQALGSTITLLGSEAILSAVVEDEGLSKLQRRDMFSARLREVDFEAGAMGTYLVRDRSPEKGSAAGSARQARRDARRAAHIAATRGSAAGREAPAARPVKPEGFMGGGFVTLKAGRKISFLAGKAVWTGSPVHVNSYGLSTLTGLSVLPAAPEPHE